MDFTLKYRFVANGSTTPITSVSIYVGVVPRETERSAFTYAALNVIYIMAAEIYNAYL